MALRIVESERKLSPRTLAAFERTNGLTLPLAYRTFLLAHNGGRPEPDCFPVTLNGRVQQEMVDRFLAIHRGEFESLKTSLDQFRGRLPRGLCPIAHDAGGNQICISLRKKDGGSIHFWVHDSSEVWPVAADLEAFLSSLQPYRGVRARRAK